jgi:GxxExxY protein
MDLNKLTEQIIGAAIEVHKVLGPGLLESAYEKCLLHELTLQKLQAESQVPLPVSYKGVLLECGYRVDLLVEKLIVVEIKAVKMLEPIHDAQLITHLRLGGWKLGLLMNFNVKLLKDGLKRRANGINE